MFSQAFVCPSRGGGRWDTKCNMGPGQNVYPLPPRDQVRMSTPSPPGPGQNVYPFPPGTRSECLPLPPGTRSECLPPSPPGTRSECLPPPPRDQVRMSTPSPHRNYMQAGGTHPTGMHSCYWMFCFHVVKNLMSILALLPISSSLWKPRLVTNKLVCDGRTRHTQIITVRGEKNINL